MTVTLSSAGGSSVPNWALLASNAPTGVSTYTFSGLAGYSRYRIFAPNLVPSGAGGLQLRINADSGANYNWGFFGFSASTVTGNQTSLATFYTADSTPTTTAFSRQFDIENALLLTPKFITSTSTGYSGSVYVVNGFGSYITTSAITSITLLMSANNFSTGTIYLLGAN